MPFLELMKKQFTGTKLLFHFLFWTFHWGIFAYGWYECGPARRRVGLARVAMLTGLLLLGTNKQPMSVWRV